MTFVYLRHRLRALEPLGDEERAERRRHEQREDDAGELAHRVATQGALSLPTTTAMSASSPASACVSASIARSSEISQLAADLARLAACVLA